MSIKGTYTLYSTKAEQVGVVWAEFRSTSKNYQNLRHGGVGGGGALYRNGLGRTLHDYI